MDGSSYYPGAAGFNAPNDTGVQSGTSFPSAVVVSIVLMLLALIGLLIQLLREHNCFMRREENATDSNRNLVLVQFNGPNSIPGTNSAVPISTAESNLSINDMVLQHAANSNLNTSVIAPSDATNSDLSTGQTARLTASSGRSASFVG